MEDGHKPAVPPVPTEEELERRTRETEAALAALKIPDDWEPLPADANCGNRALRFYRHRGTVLNNVFLLAGCPSCLDRLRARPSDVVVASFPKSGTTWLQEIVWRVVHGETGAESGGGNTLEYRFPLLDVASLPGMAMRPLDDLPEPRLMKTHLPYHLLPASVRCGRVRIIYISRDPRDVCVSYYHFSRLLSYHRYRGTFAEFRELFVRGDVTYGPYREHVRSYRAHADTVLHVTYEELHADRAAAVRRVASFLDRPVSQEDAEKIARHTSFAVMKENPACNFRHWEQNGMVMPGQGTFMRKGEMGDWRNYFSVPEGEAFLKWAEEPV